MTLTHLNAQGEAHMVDVGAKPDAQREAEAEAIVEMSAEAYQALVSGNLKKGDALGVARIAGIMAAKRTSDLIPLCHPLPLTHVEVVVTPQPVESGARGTVRINARVACVGKTGVEMEALTAASIAALTVYDMVKGLDRSALIRQVRLIAKRGGKSGEWTAAER
ncbi:MAG: cyclic pyranopterin monophosphate synthase MoaC [Thermoflexales bacterium]|nr:cyclic pyranopterin monophosphate synthase MoaC [Thermoflexales bacterium]MDW8291607.1 cyclic pyranopterin monophosphate synthase MoaC [Anaerolineae bacterium]